MAKYTVYVPSQRIGASPKENPGSSPVKGKYAQRIDRLGLLLPFLVSSLPNRPSFLAQTENTGQWWIQDFPTLQRGAQTYDFAKFSQKLYEIERIWAPTGGACPSHPP